MKCPNCGADLALAESQGVEIDYCPKCRGNWLERGKLDKIIEKSFLGYGPKNINFKEQPTPFQGDHYDSEGHHGHDGRYSGHKRKGGRRGFLGKIFDF